MYIELKIPVNLGGNSGKVFNKASRERTDFSVIGVNFIESSFQQRTATDPPHVIKTVLRNNMNKKSEFHIQNVSKLFIQYNSHFQLMAIGQIGVPGPRVQRPVD